MQQSLLLSWILYIFVVIPVLVFSTQVWQDPTFHRGNSTNPGFANFNDTTNSQSFLRHAESRTNYVLESGVCPLGRAWFYVFVLVLFVFLVVATCMPARQFTKQAVYWQTVLMLFVVGTALGMVINLPLLIRSIPALAAAAVIIIMSSQGK